MNGESLIILGRQPKLGLAELESLYGGENVRPVGSVAAIVRKKPGEISFARLGGMVKFCKILSTLDTVNWHEIQKFLGQAVPAQAEALPEGKLSLGLSAYELKVSPGKISATALELKKLVRKSGRPVRVVPNTEAALNSAQVLHNKLTAKGGWELVFVRDGSRTIVAQSVAVQDIEQYTLRDRGRPKRDPRVGMLPPKLAQIIINLAAGQTETSDKILLDPFCGTGVVLQEATMVGFKVYGTDIDERMIEYSDKNLMWLLDQPRCPVKRPDDAGLDWRYFKLEVGDAASHNWQNFDLVASETYLGRPFTSLPSSEILERTISDCNSIIKKFLQNIHEQTTSGTRFCIAVPAWQVKPGQFRHLPLIDQIENLGYNRISFEQVRSKDLIYYREDQIVARQLLVLERN